jgi:hypothetical protein
LGIDESTSVSVTRAGKPRVVGAGTCGWGFGGGADVLAAGWAETAAALRDSHSSSNSGNATLPTVFLVDFFMMDSGSKPDERKYNRSIDACELT